jgi:hypothetical protein
MTIDFLKTADFLQGELQIFYRALRRGGNKEELQLAIERLQTAIDHVEPLANDPGEVWQTLAMEQRWGYMRVLSHLGTATHELKSIDKSTSLAS